MTVTKNKWFLSLLALFFGVFLWYGSITAYKLYLFYSIDSKIKPVSITWKIEQKSEEKFLIWANYSFKVKEKIYQGSDQLEEGPYRNLYAAEKSKTQAEQNKWVILYSQNNPEINTLERNFPYKESLYTAIMVFLILYFIGLATYTEVS